MEPVTLRVATVADAAACLAIYEPYVLNTAITFEYEVPSLEDFEGRISRTLVRYPWIVAESEGRIIGYAYAGPLKGRAAYDWSVEVSIYVDGSAHKRGVGRALYEKLEELLGALGIINLFACIACPEVEDEYLTNNSVDFHQHMGYKVQCIFERVASKFGRWYGMTYARKNIGVPQENPTTPLWFSEFMAKDNQEA